MPAENHEFTLSTGDLGCSEGPSTGDFHKAEGQIDVTLSLEARQDVPYQHDFHRNADVNFAPDRVDVADPTPESGVPNPGSGYAGQPLDFMSIAPDRTERQYEPEHDIDGVGAPPASGTGVLFRGKTTLVD